ncbi:hypothetical protein DITRI_Ditri19aG0057500 [Diplodiscus trichospermus]
MRDSLPSLGSFVNCPVPWYLPSDKDNFSLCSFLTKNMVLEIVGFALKGSQRVQDCLEKAAEGLVEGGRNHLQKASDGMVHKLIKLLLALVMEIVLMKGDG